MTTHLVTTDSRSWAAVEETLAGYLPGLGVTLVNLDARRALLDGAVLKALRLQYGPRGGRPCWCLPASRNIRLSSNAPCRACWTSGRCRPTAPSHGQGARSLGAAGWR